MGPRTGLDDVKRRKFLILPGLELRPLSRPASSHTDCAIPAHIIGLLYTINSYSNVSDVCLYTDHTQHGSVTSSMWTLPQARICNRSAVTEHQTWLASL
jgi:hypothetical protein